MRLSLMLATAGLSVMLIAARPFKARTLDRAIRQTHSLKHAFLGMEVVDLEKRRVLYARNADALFIPASNTKLFSSALALARLGPDYRFHTRVIAQQSPDASGRLTGDLIFIGGGDPSMSARPYPYAAPVPQAIPKPPEPAIAAVEELADQIVAKGLREVDGDVVGDDSRYPWEPYPEGWAVGDILWEYGAPVSAFVLNDNSMSLSIATFNENDPALNIAPINESVLVQDQARPSDPQGLHIVSPRPGDLLISGTLSSSQVTRQLAIREPARFAAQSLKDALERRGVLIQGAAVARHRFFQNEPLPASEGVELAGRTSPPLSQLLQVTAKVSQNLHAEIMLREVSAVRGSGGSRQAGLDELKAFLVEAGIDPQDCHFTDGSGLSRDNLVTPAAITKLLAYMYASPYRDVWLSLLPIGKLDGTLSNRFEHVPARQSVLAANIHAKTGSLSHVRALSGYAFRSGSGPLAFSFLVNHFDAPADNVADFLDEAALLLIK